MHGVVVARGSKAQQHREFGMIGMTRKHDLDHHLRTVTCITPPEANEVECSCGGMRLTPPPAVSRKRLVTRESPCPALPPLDVHHLRMPASQT